MSPRRALSVLLFLAAAACLRLPAQDPTADFAQRLAAVLVPAVDDPDAQVRRAIETALACARSPAATLLASEARNRAEDVADPKALREWLAQALARTPPTGLLQQRLQELDWRLWRRTGGPAPADPFAACARAVEVIGPFGSGGGQWLDEPEPPDAGFPAAGARMPGRFGEVAVRLVARSPDRYALSLTDPRRPLQGACYLRWRVAAAAEAVGFVEVEYNGPFLVRVDGTEIGRADPVLVPSCPLQRLPVHLTAGEHAIVVKTGDNSNGTLALRLVDAIGGQLAGTAEVDPAAPLPAATAAAADPRDAGSFRDGLTALEQAVPAAGDAGPRAIARTAAAWAAQRFGETDRLLALLLQLQKEPPQEPLAGLLLADVWRRTDAWPEEQRNAFARELEDAAAKALPGEHLGAVLAHVRQYEDKDRGEDALRLLRKAVDAGRAGPATFAAMAACCRRLKFAAEEGAVVQLWAERCPRDPRPRLRLAERANELGDSAAALAQYQQALALQPSDEEAQRGVLQKALQLGNADAARAAIDLLYPAAEQDRQRGLWRLLALANLAQRLGDDAQLRELSAKIAAHPCAGADDLHRLADRWLALGDRKQALAACEQSLQLQPDQFELLELRARLDGPKAPGADFARFRRDGDAAIAAFKPGPEDGEATTSVCIDQRIVELLPDGSYTAETHELRRINDLSGVDELDNAHSAAAGDELLSIRTVDKAGRTYVPVRVQKGFSMPRLEPGAFVEWRYLDHGRAPGAGALRLEEFLFGSGAEPLHVTEYVLIVPKDARGALRLRSLPPPTRKEELDDNRTALVFTKEHVPRLAEESSPPPVEELVPVAAWGEDEPAWPELRQLRAGMLSRSRPTPPIAAFVREQLAGVDGDAERLRKLYAFCQTEIADGRANDATEVLLTRKGNRFLLLQALLRAAGLDAVPAACRQVRRQLEREAEPMFAHGDVLDMPALFVRPRDGAPAFVFADSPRHLPLGTVPALRSGAPAYLLSATGAESVQLPAAASGTQDLQVDGSARFDGDAIVVAGRAVIGDVTGYRIADDLRRRTQDVRGVAARQILQQVIEHWRIKSAKVAELEPPGKPLQLDFEVQNAGPQPDGDDRWLLPLPLPTNDLRDSFADREQRTLPLRITRDMQVRHRLAIDPGDDREFGPLPAPLLLSYGPLDYELTFTRTGNKVVIDRRLRLQPATIPVALYADWLRVLTEVDRAEKQSLPLKKRTAGPLR
jgi:hypothetical protein